MLLNENGRIIPKEKEIKLHSWVALYLYDINYLSCATQNIKRI